MAKDESNKEYDFVTCRCKKIESTGSKTKTHIGKDCKCSRATEKGKIEKFKSKEGILTETY